MSRYVKGVFIILLFGVLELKANFDCNDLKNNQNTYKIEYKLVCNNNIVLVLAENISSQNKIKIKFCMSNSKKPNNHMKYEIELESTATDSNGHKYYIFNDKKVTLTPDNNVFGNNFLKIVGGRKTATFNPLGNNEISIENGKKGQDCEIKFTRYSSGKLSLTVDDVIYNRIIYLEVNQGNEKSTENN